MSKENTARHFLLIGVIVIVWTAIVIGFSTSMGERPLRFYDWGPPASAGLITLIVMFIDRSRKR